MKISELPEEIKQLALLRQQEANISISGFLESSDILEDAFSWANTKEGLDYWRDWNNKELKDTIVESVVERFKQRSKVGIEKYGVTLDRTDLTRLEWLQHAQEEAMDMILYLEKLKQFEQ
jgi:hypothetical protein